MVNFNMRGGIRMQEDWKNRPAEALIYFIQNCASVKILTDDSYSCITYDFSGFTGVESPYLKTRTVNLDEPVTRLLFKVGLLARNGNDIECDIRRRNSARDSYGGKMMIVPAADIKREVDIQNDIFQKTFSLQPTHIFEPCCPAIICWSTNIYRTVRDDIYKIISSKLQQRQPSNAGFNSDQAITDSIFKGVNTKYEMSLIVMEMMEGYQRLADFFGTAKYANFATMKRYELTRINDCGYIHNDEHDANCMINPDYPYFTDKKRDSWFGRAIIIDFGRTHRIGQPAPYGGVTNRDSMVIAPSVKRELDAKRTVMSAAFFSTFPKDKQRIIIAGVLESIKKSAITLTIINPVPAPAARAAPATARPAAAAARPAPPTAAADAAAAARARADAMPRPAMKGEDFYKHATGSLPSESVIDNPWNIWNWLRLFGLFKPVRKPAPAQAKRKASLSPQQVPRPGPAPGPAPRSASRPASRSAPRPAPAPAAAATGDCPANKVTNQLMEIECIKADFKKKDGIMRILHPDKNKGCIDLAAEKFKYCANIHEKYEKNQPGAREEEKKQREQAAKDEAYAKKKNDEVKKEKERAPPPPYQARPPPYQAPPPRQPAPAYKTKTPTSSPTPSPVREVEEEEEEEDTYSPEKSRSAYAYNNYDDQFQPNQGQDEPDAYFEFLRQQNEEAQYVQFMIDQFKQNWAQQIQYVNDGFNSIIMVLNDIFQMETLLLEYINNGTITQEIYAEANERVFEHKNTVDAFKNEFEAYFVTLRDMVFQFYQDGLIVTALFDVIFREYFIQIEELNMGISLTEGLINERWNLLLLFLGIQQQQAETIDYDYGGPMEIEGGRGSSTSMSTGTRKSMSTGTRKSMSTGTRKSMSTGTGSQKQMVLYKENNLITFNSVNRPWLSGIKEELTTKTLAVLKKEYNIGDLVIENADIPKKVLLERIMQETDGPVELNLKKFGSTRRASQSTRKSGSAVGGRKFKTRRVRGGRRRGRV